MSTDKNEVTTLEVSDDTAASDASNPIKKRIFSNIFTKKFLIILLAGQFLSFCITVTIITNGALAERGANFPTTMTLLNYVLLFIVYAPKAIYEKGFRGWIEAFRANWWQYLLFSFADVEGNYFVVKAYDFTSILSIMLLDTWTTPCVVILSLIFLKVKYRWIHYVAVLICLVGIGAVVGGDLQTGNQGDMFKYVNLALGDVFCIIGSTCYAVSNVAEEYLVKQKRPLYEIVSQLGFFGIIISVIQIAIFEQHQVTQAVWTKEIIGLVIAYNIAMFCLYTVVPLLFRRASATFFNLSLLTSDFYSLIFAIILFQAKIHALYPVAFIGTMVGLALFNLYQPEERESKKDDEEEAKDESNKDNIKE